ncbi:DUF4064 domain-containing protein [Lactiplantibacillus sp. WILCCON 0030]|uniref:DUF4064 domain-containing protein n=1 Tax=Lactiplantibacillus brownii TaxID=3069269 RepID=A0ABU1ABP8_9LACO|nr:DUF4064 domain-containing protein [Lactiplantibacillus brownii]MDQ7938408.1 DUF4064 domain-containing protein [Lactiplantibacillus brownii]
MSKQTIIDENGQKYVQQTVKSTHRSRTAELVLGIIGGIFGMFGGILAMGLGGLGSAIGASGSSSLGSLGGACIAVSALAIVLAALINKNHKLMGWLIIICGVLNIVFVSYFGILSGLLIIIAGGLALRK